MNFKTLSKKALNFVNTIKRGYAGHINAERDWAVLLIIAAIALLLSAVTNAIFFARVYEGEPLSQNTNTNPEPKETQEISDRLKEIETIFEVRENEKDAFVDTSYPFVDPARN
tara:strand:+ start:40242 stop:40580 length:339 start_codon:yes stop_codon:yes gene_type:complete